MWLLPLGFALLAAHDIRPAILGGTTSESSDDATVMLVHLEPGATTSEICTGALIAPRLVLTARHCVARTDPNVACNVDGTPLRGAVVEANYEAADLYVFTGKDRPAFVGSKLDEAKWKPAGRGAEILDDGATTLCNHDLALVLLREPIADNPIASVRLDGNARAGEKLTAIGWGITGSDLEPGTRQRRNGVTVKRVGPDEAIPTLTPSEFLFDESICLGDSGGAVFAEATQAIVGVVSRGGNGLSPETSGLAATCAEADNLATKLAPFRDFLLEGYRRAGAEPRLEPPRDDDGGCSSAGGLRHRDDALAVALAFVITAVLRRRGRQK